MCSPYLQPQVRIHSALSVWKVQENILEYSVWQIKKITAVVWQLFCWNSTVLWLACLIKFKPHQKHLLFPGARNFIYPAWYWLDPGNELRSETNKLWTFIKLELWNPFLLIYFNIFPIGEKLTWLQPCFCFTFCQMNVNMFTTCLNTAI